MKFKYGLGRLQANWKGAIMIILVAPSKPSDLQEVQLICGRRSLVGSLVGGIKETQEMLDYCAEHNITSDV